MNDRQIQAFLAIVEFGSMNQAAERLFITQPALKKRLDSLERELGARLFIRNVQGCALTPAGAILADGAPALLAHMEDLAASTRNAAQTETVRVCMFPDSPSAAFDTRISTFRRARPNCQVKRVLLPTGAWIDAVANGDADLCNSYLMGDALWHERRGLRPPARLWHADLVILASDAHPFARRSSITFEDLRTCSHVVVGPLLHAAQAWQNLASNHGITARVENAAGMHYELIDLCEKGAVCVQSQGFARQAEPLRAIPIEGAQLEGGWVSRANPSPAALAFVRHFEDLT